MTYPNGKIPLTMLTPIGDGLYMENRAVSNNWVVSGARTATGYPLLAGDPHLDLTLPSTWYEAHLVVPDRLDVQGITLPGGPWVVMGFNREDAEAGSALVWLIVAIFMLVTWVRC